MRRQVIECDVCGADMTDEPRPEKRIFKDIEVEDGVRASISLKGRKGKAKDLCHVCILKAVKSALQRANDELDPEDPVPDDGDAVPEMPEVEGL